MNDAIRDLATITNIPYFTLQTLLNKLIDIVQYDVQESILNKEDVSEIDIHIGKLIIARIDDDIKFKFIPSSKLENSVINIFNGKECGLIQSAQDSMCNKVMTAYKDLL